MDRYEKYTRLKFTRPHPHVLRIAITTDTKHNLMDPEMHHELGQIWRDIDDDESVSAAILTAAGASFSAGGNIKRQKDTYDFEDRARTMKEAHAIVYNMINCSKPIVSAVRGWRWGRGLPVPYWEIFPLSPAMPNYWMATPGSELRLGTMRSCCGHSYAEWRGQNTICCCARQ